MAFYSVLAVTPTSGDWGEAYVKETLPILRGYGGRYLARTNSHEQLEGAESSAVLRILIEWPSRDAAVGFMNDPGYRPHLEARTRGSVSEHLLIEGQDDLIG